MVVARSVQVFLVPVRKSGHEHDGACPLELPTEAWTAKDKFSLFLLNQKTGAECISDSGPKTGFKIRTGAFNYLLRKTKKEPRTGYQDWRGMQSPLARLLSEGS